MEDRAADTFDEPLASGGAGKQGSANKNKYWH